jgi:crotonobetainyl-CoA:carnitine CoA-transferase CaiB-like acyl-CoA transferase
VADLIDHAYVKGREAMVELEDPDLGRILTHNIIPRLSASPGGFRRPAPRLGEHTGEVMRELEP